MDRFFNAAFRAVRSLPHGKLVMYLFLGIFINLSALAGLVGGIVYLLGSTNWFAEWDLLTDWGFGLFSVAAAWFLFPIFLPLIISFFDTAIAEVIEKNEYPGLKTAEPPFWPTLQHDILFTLKALGINLIALPFYFIPGVYYAVNGYLLGTEFFNVIAGRYVSPEQAQALRSRHRWSIILCGASIAFAATVPFINLIAPIWGVALMVHYFHSLNGREPREL